MARATLTTRATSTRLWRNGRFRAGTSPSCEPSVHDRPRPAVSPPHLWRRRDVLTRADYEHQSAGLRGVRSHARGGCRGKPGEPCVAVAGGHVVHPVPQQHSPARKPPGLHRPTGSGRVPCCRRTQAPKPGGAWRSECPGAHHAARIASGQRLRGYPRCPLAHPGLRPQYRSPRPCLCRPADSYNFTR